MRLGGLSAAFAASTVEELGALCPELDRLGLSAIPAPGRLAEMSDDECAAFGEAARVLGLVVGEAGMWENLMTRDADLRDARIERVRTLLRKADLMGCHCVVTLVGSGDASDDPLAPDPVMFSDEGAKGFREVVERILDGLTLERTRYGVEPWRTSFFYEPKDIAAFLDLVGHPSLGVHLDLVNMVGRRTYVDTAGLAVRTFALLSERIVGAHLKDLRWDHDYLSLKWDEVPIGDGVVDHAAVLAGLARLDEDLACFCEHLETHATYEAAFARLHGVAAGAGLRFVQRTVPRTSEGGGDR
jgi:sugar phosphate isomerase/epimerase